MDSRVSNESLVASLLGTQAPALVGDKADGQASYSARCWRSVDGQPRDSIRTRQPSSPGLVNPVYQGNQRRRLLFPTSVVICLSVPCLYSVFIYTRR